jgi:hypothetical protein
MSAIQRISDRMAEADIVAFDSDDRPILIVAADIKVPESWLLGAYLEVLGSIRRDIPFVILANAEEMTIYRKDRTRSIDPIATIPTKETLRFYNPDFGKEREFKSFLVAMIDAWLRDFIYHWKSPEPPQSEVMTAVGLAARLENGSSRTEVRLACLPLRGDKLPPELRHWAEPRDGGDPLKPVSVPSADHS